MWSKRFRSLDVTNNQSSSTGLQKALLYNLNLETKELLTLEVFKALTETFLKKRGEAKGSENRFRFKLDDSRHAIDINFPIAVSSNTEYEITFYSTSELPFLGVLVFMSPIEFYTTIVPTSDKLKGKEGYYHYKSVIHGLSEINGALKVKSK